MLEINSNMLLKKHRRSAQIRSPLSKNLRNEFGKGNARVIKGDTVKILRGEYKNVEGKVERVNTEKSTLVIEGVQKEIAKGGKIKVHIHSSNVMITSLIMQDKRRGNTIQKIKLESKEKVKKSHNKNKRKSSPAGKIGMVGKGLKVDQVLKRTRKATVTDIKENNKGEIRRKI